MCDFELICIFSFTFFICTVSLNEANPYYGYTITEEFDDPE